MILRIQLGQILQLSAYCYEALRLYYPEAESDNLEAKIRSVRWELKAPHEGGMQREVAVMPLGQV